MLLRARQEGLDDHAPAGIALVAGGGRVGLLDARASSPPFSLLHKPPLATELVFIPVCETRVGRLADVGHGLEAAWLGRLRPGEISKQPDDGTSDDDW